MKALVTGASSGMGRDIAIYLSELGYDVILVSRDENRLKETANKIKTNVEIYPIDLTGRDNCFKLYDHFKDEDIDILVNGAGFGLFGNTWETDINKELKMIDLNVTAVHILTKLFLQDMVKKDKGYIMNISSSAGFLAGPGLNTYYATKNYVTKWTTAIYQELKAAKSKVRICALCPGPVDTNFNKVAGGSFTVKALSSEYVAHYAVDQMFKNKLLIVPGFTVRAGMFFNRFLPTKLSLKIVHNIQRKKVEKNG
jgi:short-subunit dehydrogenase